MKYFRNGEVSVGKVVCPKGHATDMGEYDVADSYVGLDTFECLECGETFDVYIEHGRCHTEAAE